ncbi:hypothetical protein HK101_006255 [Irineochytrium annulatum]|nr:hypothetical protein HK101_006255 [Irineochytrium annulatum]
MPENGGVQVLPVQWRQKIDFGKKRKPEAAKAAMADEEAAGDDKQRAEDQLADIEDIQLEGRNLKFNGKVMTINKDMIATVAWSSVRIRLRLPTRSDPAPVAYPIKAWRADARKAAKEKVRRPEEKRGASTEVTKAARKYRTKA